MRYLPEGISTWEEYEEEKQKFIDILMDHIEIEDVRSERTIEFQDMGTGREFFRNYMEQDHKIVISHLHGDTSFDEGAITKTGPFEVLRLEDEFNYFKIVSIDMTLLDKLPIKYLSISVVANDGLVFKDNDTLEEVFSSSACESYTFINVPNLTKLYCSSENAESETFPVQFQNSNSIKFMTIYGYTIKTLRSEDLAGLENLERLDLDGTKIEGIENNALDDLISLKYLEISCPTFPENIFDKCRNLESLRLIFEKYMVSFNQFRWLLDLKRLSLVGGTLNVDCDALQNNSNLVDFSVGRVTDDSELCYSWISSTTKLERFTGIIYSDSQLDEIDWTAVTDLTDLTLYIKMNNIPNFTFLYELPKLTSITIFDYAGKLTTSDFKNYYLSRKLNRAQFDLPRIVLIQIDSSGEDTYTIVSEKLAAELS